MGQNRYILASAALLLLTFVTNVYGGALPEKAETSPATGEGNDSQGGEESFDWETDGEPGDSVGIGGEDGERIEVGFGRRWRRRWWCKGKWIELVVPGPKPSHCRRRPTGKMNVLVLWCNQC